MFDWSEQFFHTFISNKLTARAYALVAASFTITQMVLSQLILTSDKKYRHHINPIGAKSFREQKCLYILTSLLTKKGK